MKPYQPAFRDPAAIGWVDFETRGKIDIDAGATRYATEADAIMLAYAIGDAPAQTVTSWLLGRLPGGVLCWSDMPPAVQEHHARVLRGEAVWAAWNSSFDKAIWNFATIDFPQLEPHHIIDVMAQATANGLAGQLAQAAKQCGTSNQKDTAGKQLIELFSKQGASPQAHPAEWLAFAHYAMADIDAMRGVFRRTRQLTAEEWAESWAMERVNDRGIYIDVPMVTHAAKLAAEDKVRSNAELSALTNGAITTVDQVARMVDWLRDRLPPEGQKVLLSRPQKVDDNGVLVREAKHNLTRRKVERLLPMAIEKNLGDDVVRLLQIRLYGGSKTPAKFARMLEQELDGVLYGQYTFNGAPQTGRASSRGVQIHNLARDTLKYEPEAIDALLLKIPYDTLATFGDSSPVSRKLSLLIRPAFVPGGDRVFVWSDWAQIEARVLPWLVGDDPGALERLQIFRDVDNDPSVPDLYTRTAANISGLPVEEITEGLRQRGKVAELALGFLGGVGALQAMAAGYGLNLDDADAKQIVAAWRDANPWSGLFGRNLWTTCELARNMPGEAIPCGRLVFIFLPDLLEGSLLIRLPSGRYLTYRALRMEALDVTDEYDEPTGEKRLELTYGRGFGRAKLWPGVFVENVTQATAADFLRGTLVRLEAEGFVTRLHTHDEILVECAAENAEYIAGRLREVMQRGFDWSEGLPIMSEETMGYYYTKHKGSRGL